MLEMASEETRFEPVKKVGPLTESFTLAMRPSMRERISQEARVEERSDSAIARILLEEALDARDAARVDRTPDEAIA